MGAGACAGTAAAGAGAAPLGRRDSEAAAIGVADKKWGERPLVLIVVEDADFDPTTVLNTFSQAADEGVISRWAVPERVEIVNEIPKTSVGKIDKKFLREQYSD